MKAIIHYNGKYEDDITIKGNTIEELREKAREATNKRGWEEEHCWSEVLDEEESEDSK